MTTLAPWEENLFEKITDHIIESDEGYLPEVEAVNLGLQLKVKKATATETEEAIHKLVINRLILRENDCLMLSGLTLVEQQQILEATYPEVCAKCFTCKIITVRVRTNWLFHKYYEFVFSLFGVLH